MTSPPRARPTEALNPWQPVRGERVRFRADGCEGVVEDVDYMAVKVLFDDGEYGIFVLDEVAAKLDRAIAQAEGT